MQHAHTHTHIHMASQPACARLLDDESLTEGGSLIQEKEAARQQLKNESSTLMSHMHMHVCTHYTHTQLFAPRFAGSAAHFRMGGPAPAGCCPAGCCAAAPWPAASGLLPPPSLAPSHTGCTQPQPQPIQPGPHRQLQSCCKGSCGAAHPLWSRPERQPGGGTGSPAQHRGQRQPHWGRECSELRRASDGKAGGGCSCTGWFPCPSWGGRCA